MFVAGRRRTAGFTCDSTSLDFDVAGRADYAGDQTTIEYGEGSGGNPNTFALGNSPSFHWPDTSKLTGVVIMHDPITVSDIVDGTSYTYLVGEKQLCQDVYFNTACGGDRESLYVGFGNDTCRTGYFAPVQDLRETGSVPYEQWRFGSAREGGFHMAMCDGSVQTVSYAIDLTVHRNLADRQDENAVDLDTLAP